MLDKLNLYDLLGRLLPGAAVTLGIYWITTALGAQLPPLSTDLGSSLVFLGASYVVGKIVHTAGSALEDAFNKSHGGRRYYERMVTSTEPDKPGTKSADLRRAATDVAKKIFPMDPGSRDVFELCYEVVVQKGLAQHVEVFLGLTGIARSMMAVCGFGIVFAFVAQALLLLVVVVDTSRESAELWLGAALAGIAFAVAAHEFYLIFVHFRETFSRSVYYNFLAWYGAEKLKPAG